MESWQSIAWFTGFGLLLLLPVYMIIHMLYNRYHGKDELEGLFKLRPRKRK
jgi:hypothetical protein